MTSGKCKSLLFLVQNGHSDTKADRDHHRRWCGRCSDRSAPLARRIRCDRCVAQSRAASRRSSADRLCLHPIAVLERNDFTGGRCSLLYDKDGHRFDAGPSLLLLPKLFEEAFKDLGTTMKEEINIVKCGQFGILFHCTLLTILCDCRTELQDPLPRWREVYALDRWAGAEEGD